MTLTHAKTLHNNIFFFSVQTALKDNEVAVGVVAKIFWKLYWYAADVQLTYGIVLLEYFSTAVWCVNMITYARTFEMKSL